MKMLVVLTCIFLFTTGCTITSPRFAEGGPESIEALNKLVNKRRVVLNMKDSTHHFAEKPDFGSSQTSYQSPGEDARKHLNTCKITAIKIHGNIGYWIGYAGIGSGIALIATGVYGELTYKDLALIKAGLNVGAAGLVVSFASFLIGKRPNRAKHTVYQLPSCTGNQ